MPTHSDENAGFGIYVHWPFCLHKCPYCDFNSHVSRQIDHDAWGAAYIAALSALRDYRPNEPLTSVYFGGGTPSTCPPKIIDEILNKIATHWNLADAEITLEANPTSVEKQKFSDFANAGVNRLSLGFQAFNNEDLKLLGRMHSVEESLQALDIARKYFARTNFDVIYARQNQTVHAWENELNQLLALSPSHISLYQLTIEPNTRFGEMYAKGKLKGLPDEARSHEMYSLTRDFMRDNGFEHYEVSNFCRPGDYSRHNLVYWNYGDYLGIGPGAHGRMWRDGARVASFQESMPNQWLQAPDNFEIEILDKRQAAEEYVLMGLRVETGIRFERLDALGLQLPAHKLAELIDFGLIAQNNHGIRATDEGRLVLNYVIEKLLA